MKYTGDSIIQLGLSPQTAKPLDDRLVVEKTSDLYEIPVNLAYLGMPVINALTGTIYILTDVSKIKSKDGWVNSYEQLQVLTLTEEEYNTLVENGGILDDRYYYIKEPDSIDGTLVYVSYKLYLELEESVSNKASNNSVKKVSDAQSELANKITSIEAEYVKQDSESGSQNITDILSEFKQTLDLYNLDTFVSKSDVTGEGSDAEFIFVKTEDYNSDKEALNETISNIEEDLSKTVKTDSDGTVNALTATSISTNSLTINSLEAAVKNDIPKIVYVTAEEYEALIKDASTIYMIYGNSDIDPTGYVTADILDNYFKAYLQAHIGEYIDAYMNKQTTETND